MVIYLLYAKKVVLRDTKYLSFFVFSITFIQLKTLVSVIGIRAVKSAMVITRTNPFHNEPIMSTPDQIDQQLTTIAIKLGAIDALVVADVAALKAKNK